MCPQAIPNYIRSHPYMCAALAGAVTTLAIPPMSITVLAFVGYAVLALLLFEEQKTKKAAIISWLFVFMFHLIGLHWISAALLVDWKSHFWLLPFSLAGLPLLLTLYSTALIALSVHITKPKTLSRWIGITFAWIVAELLRSHYLFTGFPWNIPAHIWVPGQSISQAAELINVHGVSILTCLMLFSSVFLFYEKRKWLLCIPALLIFGSLYLHGYTQLLKSTDELIDDVQIILVQPNIPQNEKWAQNLKNYNFEKRLIITREALLEHPSNKTTLVVWPETALSYDILEDPRYTEQLASALPENTYLISGLLSYTDKQWHNSVIVLDNKARLVEKYNKFHLVPFGEYVPFSNILPIESLVGISDFEKGSGITTLGKEQSYPTFQPLICYEAIFPNNLASSESGMSFIINVTNDGWYGNGWGPRQHLAHISWRAIESRKPIIRSAGTGISAVINRYGQITHSQSYNTGGYIQTGNL